MFVDYLNFVLWSAYSNVHLVFHWVVWLLLGSEKLFVYSGSMPLSVTGSKCLLLLMNLDHLIKNNFLNWNVHFEIAGESHAVGRNKTGRSQVPVTQFLPSLTSGKTLVQYHKQDIDRGPLKIQSISITTRIPLISLFSCWEPPCLVSEAVNPHG